MNNLVTFVIGATATGKTHFIQKYFSEKDVERLNIFNYQQNAYREAGIDGRFLTSKNRKCLYEANEKLLSDIINLLQQGRSVVVEHTLFKAKRRVSYIEAIRKAVTDVQIEFFVMCPSETRWESFIAERSLEADVQYYKGMAKEIEFPNPAEGIDRIFQVVDGDIQLRMDIPTPEIIPLARRELEEEAERMHREEERKAKHRELLDSMNSRPFWHYCEVCGRKSLCTAETAFSDGWDYPPHIGKFGLLGPRKCGSCSLKDTLFWKVVVEQGVPLVIESSLTEDELVVWQRIKGEPESLLEEEK